MIVELNVLDGNVLWAFVKSDRALYITLNDNGMVGWWWNVKASAHNDVIAWRQVVHFIHGRLCVLQIQKNKRKMSDNVGDVATR
jgi:hypothetical protein